MSWSKPKPSGEFGRQPYARRRKMRYGTGEVFETVIHAHDRTYVVERGGNWSVLEYGEREVKDSQIYVCAVPYTPSQAVMEAIQNKIMELAPQ
jgi:hypothetical protein